MIFLLYLLTAVVETYELSGKQTYISMAILAMCMAVVLLSVIPLYRQLAPRSVVQEEQYYVVSPFTAKDDEDLGTRVGLSQLCSKNCLLFYSFMLEKPTYYSHNACRLFFNHLPIFLMFK